MAVPKKKRSKALSKTIRSHLIDKKLKKIINTFSIYKNLNIKNSKWVATRNTNLYYSSWILETWYVRALPRFKKYLKKRSNLKK